MKTLITVVIILVVILAVGYGFNQFLPWDLIRPSVVAEPVLMLGGFAVTNSMLITLVVDLLLIAIVFAATRKPSLVPSGMQNLMEVVVEAIHNLVNQTVGGNEKLTRWFFPWVATIFLLVLPANLLGLVPGFGPLGIVHKADEKQQPPVGVVVLTGDLGPLFHVPPEAHVPPKPAEEAASEEKAEFVPLFRAPSSDLNLTLALAIIAMVMVQAYGVMHLGPLTYLSKFIVLGKLSHGVGALLRGDAKSAIGLLLLGLIDFIVGILELFSEFVKVVSFTFRLFGNIFAGEVVLLVMAFLGTRFVFPLLPLPFYALEVLVAFIQAFIFAMLTLVFMTLATTPPHGAEEHH